MQRFNKTRDELNVTVTKSHAYKIKKNLLLNIKLPSCMNKVLVSCF